MSAIRLAGVIGAVLLLAVLFLRFRTGSLRRSDFTLGLLVGVTLLTVSLFPGSVSILRDMLALEQTQFSRLIAILIVATAALWMLYLSLRARLSSLDDKFDRLIRATAVRAWIERPEIPPPRTSVLVVIPAFNEAENIGHVMEAMPDAVAGLSVSVLVIDDGSSDQTPEQARSHGAAVISSPMNRGGGAALRIGFDIAHELGAQIVVTMDADGQHLPQEIEGLVAPIVADEADIVVGSRILGRREKDSLIRLVGIHFFNLVIRVLTPVRVTDCSSGFRALRTNVIHRLLLRQDQYHTTELIIDAARRGCRIAERPITVRRRLSGTSKKGGSWIYGLSFGRTILRTWWR